MLTISALLVAGLGLFFLGLHHVGLHLKHATSRRLRDLLAWVTNRSWLGAIMGVVAGAVMQSTSAVTVLLASMASSRVITVRQALPVVAWANVGTTILVFVAVLDIHLAVLYLLGMSAVAFAFAKEDRWKGLYGVLLGVALILYGIDTMKDSAANLQKFSWFRAVMEQANGSYLTAFVIATVLSFITQSTNAVVLLALTLLQSRLLRPEETMMVIYGANLGSTFARMILASGLRGSARQIGRFQDLLRVTGSVLFVLLFYLEVYARLPLVRALVEAVAPRVGTQMALVNLVYNLTMALLFSLAAAPLQTLLERYWPATADEDLATPHYLYPEALEEPDTAIDLLEKEQARFLGRVPDYLLNLREQGEVDTVALHQAFAAIAREMGGFLRGLLDKSMSPQTSERVMNLQNRQSLIEYIEEALYELVRTARGTPHSGALDPLVRRFAEGLDFMLRLAGRTLADPESEERELLGMLCGDRGELMEKIRKAYAAGPQELTAQDRALLFSLTGMFERVVWMVNRLARLLGHTVREGD